jgi:lamin tail-like protein
MRKVPRGVGRAVATGVCGLLLAGLMGGPVGATTRAARNLARPVGTHARGRVTITAAYYDPKAGPDPDTNRGRNKEYVVIRNGGNRAVRLTRWTLRDLARTGQRAHVFRFPSFRLRPGRSVKIHTGSGRNTRTDLYWGSSVYVWGDDSDRATLKSSGGTTVDSCSWTASDTSPKFC